MGRRRGLGAVALVIFMGINLLLTAHVHANSAPRSSIPNGSQSGTIAANATAPGGLVAVLADTVGQPLDLSVMQNPSIRGVALQIHWSAIEPVEGNPDWSKLDALFSSAASAHIWVQLLIFPGFFTPRWALKGVNSARFALQYGPGKGTVMRLPMPWNGLYLGRWFAFLKLLSQRYGASPAFRIIAADGPTSVSAEATLPNTPQDRTTWQNKHFTPSRYVGAWQTVFQAYAADFPNQYISLSGGAGIESIVDINDKGMVAGHNLHTEQAIVTQAMALLGSRLVLQNSNLDGTVDGDKKAVAYLTSYNGRIVTGFQLRTSARAKGMGADGNPPLALRRSLDKGMQRNSAGQHVNYIEIYEPDILAKDMQPVLRYGASLFSAIPPQTPGPYPRGTPCGTSCM